jgi:hypothetical protein
MIGHRTTARGALLLLILIAALAVTPGAPGGPSAPAHEAPVTPIVFPVLGKASYGDDFGDPRPNGAHAGVDIVVPRRSPVVAAEDGDVKWWTTSARAGCMLYLEGASGATYLYIHLNNDRTLANDNAGSCVAGTAYTVPDGARVTAGQQIAWSGDSGDADGIPHLHFEVHPAGTAVDPKPFLDGATRSLFPARSGALASVGLRGRPVVATQERLTLMVGAIRWWPGGRWIPIDPRPVEVSLDGATAIEPPLSSSALATLADDGSPPGHVLTVFTRRDMATAGMLVGEPGALIAARVRAAPA